MVKVHREVERLKKVMDEENVDYVSVNRISRYDKDGNRQPSTFSTTISQYAERRPIRYHEDDE